MKICYAIPVADAKIGEAWMTLLKWKKMGYKTCFLTNGLRIANAQDMADHHVHRHEYVGWGWACNEMMNTLFMMGFDWVICAGHDLWPDETKSPSLITTELEQHFGGTLGVMQPGGDRWGAHALQTACTSPWIGRDWFLKANRKPFHEAYRHFYVDAELCEVARREGKLWWRDDLTQYHDHYLRHGQTPPDYLNHAHERVPADRLLFENRKANGFPGSVVLNGGA